MAAVRRHEIEIGVKHTNHVFFICVVVEIMHFRSSLCVCVHLDLFCCDCVLLVLICFAVVEFCISVGIYTLIGMI